MQSTISMTAMAHLELIAKMLQCIPKENGQNSMSPLPKKKPSLCLFGLTNIASRV